MVGFIKITAPSTFAFASAATGLPFNAALDGFVPRQPTVLCSATNGDEMPPGGADTNNGFTQTLNKFLEADPKDPLKLPGKAYLRLFLKTTEGRRLLGSFAVVNGVPLGTLGIGQLYYGTVMSPVQFLMLSLIYIGITGVPHLSLMEDYHEEFDDGGRKIDELLIPYLTHSDSEIRAKAIGQLKKVLQDYPDRGREAFIRRIRWTILAETEKSDQSIIRRKEIIKALRSGLPAASFQSVKALIPNLTSFWERKREKAEKKIKAAIDVLAEDEHIELLSALAQLPRKSHEVKQVARELLMIVPETRYADLSARLPPADDDFTQWMRTLIGKVMNGANKYHLLVWGVMNDLNKAIKDSKKSTKTKP